MANIVEDLEDEKKYPEAQPLPNVVSLIPFLAQPNHREVQPVSFGSEPMVVFCNNCQERVKTKTNSNATGKAYLLCCLLFFCGCLPCSCIPLCSWRRTKHRCPKCKILLGERES